MSHARRKTSYLSRRDGIYYLRMRVPHDLVERVGRFEIRRSLGVARLNQARPLAAKYAARAFEVFDMIRTKTYTKNEIVGVIQSIFADLSLEVDRNHFAFKTTSYDEEFAEQIFWSEEWEAQLLHSIEGRQKDDMATQSAAKLLQQNVPGLEELPTSQRHDLMIGAMRALIEQQRQFRFRLSERLLPYEPSDELFKANSGQTPQALSSEMNGPRQVQKTGPKMGDLIDRYLEAKKSYCTPKTIKMMDGKLGLLIDHLGADTQVSEVLIGDMRIFRDGVLRLRKSYSGEGGRFQERQTDVRAGQISLKTASTTFKMIKSFWNWTVKESYLETSPVGNLAVDLAGHKKIKKVRRPFTATEIEQLFSAPLFLGCRSRFRRFEVGDLVLKDAKYWIPILGYYTGARLGELVQLHIADIILDHDIPHISINEECGEGHFKHLKSDAAARTIPIHPDLLKLGFADFVRQRGEKPLKDHRLFREIKFGEDGQASTVFSKWFSQFMDKRSLSDSGLVFHSFRHGVQDIYRSSLAPQYLIDAIFGHQGSQTSDEYGLGLDLNAKFKVMVGTKWPVHLTAIL